MPKAVWSKRLQQYLLCVLAFTIPFPFITGAVTIALLVIVWLFQLNGKELFRNLKQRRALWPWLLYFLLFAISYFYSDNKTQSLFDLQTKLGLLFFPFIIGAGDIINTRMAQQIFLYFIGGITFAAFVCIGYAFYVWSITGATGSFFYHSLVAVIPDSSAVYMAWYTIFSISLLLFFPLEILQRKRYIKIILLVVQMTFFVLLASKMLIVLFFLLVAPFYVVTTFRHRHIARWKFIASAVTFILLLVVIFTTQNPIRERYEDIVHKNDLKMAWLDDYKNVDESRLSNLTIRVMAWRMGMENIIENKLWWAGAGNGDAQDLQNRRMAHYRVQNYDRDYFDETSDLYNVNLHNMYIQSLLMIGIPGLTLFLIIIFNPLVRIPKNIYKPVLITFNVSAILFMMQESAFQSQAGIVYYGFFANVFWNIYYGDKEAKILK